MPLQLQSPLEKSSIDDAFLVLIWGWTVFGLKSIGSTFYEQNSNQIIELNRTEPNRTEIFRLTFDSIMQFRFGHYGQQFSIFTCINRNKIINHKFLHRF